jgi:hypothetical protein
MPEELMLVVFGPAVDADAVSIDLDVFWCTWYEEKAISYLYDTIGIRDETGHVRMLCRGRRKGMGSEDI